jgi:hypothetical protein
MNIMVLVEISATHRRIGPLRVDLEHYFSHDILMYAHVICPRYRFGDYLWKKYFKIFKDSMVTCPTVISVEIYDHSCSPFPDLLRLVVINTPELKHHLFCPSIFFG